MMKNKVFKSTRPYVTNDGFLEKGRTVRMTMFARRQEPLQNADETSGEQRRWWRLGWKKTILVIAVLVILFVSLFYYAFPTIFHPLRVDAIPSGAYVIPWMRPDPSIGELSLHAQQPYGPPPFDIDVVMVGALKLSMTFNISIPGGYRVIPSIVYLGHDSDHLYVGGRFIGMYLNPASAPNDTLPQTLSIFFDVTSDGALKQPESGSAFAAYITPKGTGMASFHDMIWLDYSPTRRRGFWIPADNYYSIDLGKPQTAFGIDEGIKEYDNSTGTVTILFSRFLALSGNSEVNALQMRQGERWVIGFLIELSYYTNSDAGNYVDGWPRKAYPYPDNNSSWWPKLAIDISNQPTQYPGGPTTPFIPLAKLGTPNS